MIVAGLGSPATRYGTVVGVKRQYATILFSGCLAPLAVGPAGRLPYRPETGPSGRGPATRRSSR